MLYNPVGLQHINLVNQAKTPLGVALSDIVGALQKKQDEIFGPLTGVVAKFTASGAVDNSACNMILIDTARDADFYGYHDMIVGGFPSAKVLIKACLDPKEGGGIDILTSTISHEADELLGDPYANLWVDGPGGIEFAKERCDACEALIFKLGKIALSDFLLDPFFYEGTRVGTKLDYMGKVTKPFETLKDGYQTIRKQGSFKNIFGSKAKADAFAREDRELHRSTYRTGILGLPMLILPPGSPEEEAMFQRASRE